MDKDRELALLIGEAHEGPDQIYTIPYPDDGTVFTYINRRVYDLVRACLIKHGDKFLDIAMALTDDNLYGFEFEAKMKPVKITSESE